MTSPSSALNMQRLADNLSALQSIAEDFQSGKKDSAFKRFQEEIPTNIKRSIFKQVWVDDGSRKDRASDFGRKVFFERHASSEKSIRAIQHYIGRIQPMLPRQFHETRIHTWLTANDEIRLIQRGTKFEFETKNHRIKRHATRLTSRPNQDQLLLLEPVRANHRVIAEFAGNLLIRWEAPDYLITLLQKTDKLRFQICRTSTKTCWHIPIDCPTIAQFPIDQQISMLTATSPEKFEDHRLAFAQEDTMNIRIWPEQNVRLIKRVFHELPLDNPKAVFQRVEKLAIQRFDPLTNVGDSILEYPALPRDPTLGNPNSPTLNNQQVYWFVLREPILSEDDQIVRFQLVPVRLLNDVLSDLLHYNLQEAFEKFKELPSSIQEGVFDKLLTLHGRVPSQEPNFGRDLFYNIDTYSFDRFAAVRDQLIEITIAQIQKAASEFQNGNFLLAHNICDACFIWTPISSKIYKRLWELDGKRSNDPHFGKRAFNRIAYSTRISDTQRAQALEDTIARCPRPGVDDSRRCRFFFGSLFDHFNEVEWVEEPALFDPSKMITEDDWGVTLVDIGERRINLSNPKSTAGLLGHAALFIEGIENGQYWMRLAQFGMTEGKDTIRIDDINNSDKQPFLNSFKNLNKTKTWLTSFDKVSKMISAMEKYQKELAAGKTPIKFQLVSSIHSIEKQKMHNCITWAKHMLAVAGIKPPHSERWFSYVTATPGGEIEAAQEYDPNRKFPVSKSHQSTTRLDSSDGLFNWVYSYFPSLPSIFSNAPEKIKK